MGARGVGEGGAITAPDAVLNALDDAIIAAGDGRIGRTPCAPTEVLRALGVPLAQSPPDHALFHSEPDSGGQ